MHLIQGECAFNQSREDVRNIVEHVLDTGVLPGGRKHPPGIAD